jgi:hypothetical protein
MRYLVANLFQDNPARLDKNSVAIKNSLNLLYQKKEIVKPYRYENLFSQRQNFLSTPAEKSW